MWDTLEVSSYDSEIDYPKPYIEIESGSEVEFKEIEEVKLPGKFIPVQKQCRVRHKLKRKKRKSVVDVREYPKEWQSTPEVIIPGFRLVTDNFYEKAEVSSSYESSDSELYRLMHRIEEEAEINSEIVQGCGNQKRKRPHARKLVRNFY